MLIHQILNIKGVEVAGNHNKVNLFALLILSEPLTLLPNLWHLLESFGTLLGLKIKESKALNKTIDPAIPANLQTQFKFSWELHKLKYLGVYLTTSWDTMYAVNYQPLNHHLNSLLANW